MNPFTDPAPLGYDRVVMETQVHQSNIPPAYLAPGVTNGRPVLTWAGPDGVQRPLEVRLAFLQCNRCAALVAPGMFGGVSAHNAWHVRQEGEHALHGEGECPPTCELPGPHTVVGP